MKASLRFLLALSLAGGALLSGCGGDNDNNAAEQNTGPRVDLRLMETTDIHANVMDYNYYSDSVDNGHGLVRTAMLVKQARAEITYPENSALVDNGDLIQGSPMGDWRQAQGLTSGEVHPVYKVMNEMAYDVGNYGNHEFNYGLDFLAESVDDAAFPYISANVFSADGSTPYFDQYKLITKTVYDRDGNPHDLTLGFIGFLPPQIMQWDKKNLEGKVTAKDIKATAELLVPQMKAEGADIIVAIPHSGINTTAYSEEAKAENSSWYLADVDGIDAIMFGHSHLTFPSDSFANTANVDLEKGTIKGVPSVMPGYWGSHLGIIDLTLALNEDGESWTVVNSKVEARALDPEGEADAALTALVKPDHDATLNYMGQVIGESTDDIFSFLAVVKDDPSIQIVSDAQKAYVEDAIVGTELDGLPVLSAAAPFKACDRDGVCAEESSFTVVPAGELQVKNIADLYLYPNTLMAVKVTGAELEQWLECSASQFFQITDTADRQELVDFSGFPTYNFDVIDGVSYQIDVTEPARYDRDCAKVSDGSRIVNLQFEGAAIDPAQEFLIASNNYRATGGHFAGTGGDHVVIESPDENRQVVGNYIQANSPVTPTADNNWSFAPILGYSSDLQIVFRVPNTDRAKNFVADAVAGAGGSFMATLLDDSGNEAIYELKLQP
ncbi:2',3'-cyclic-nucleotide 2'-phosphodiesterase / 3'-nucleotidase [Alcanivorax sp. DSM 26293]|jgi:2',3'-cyclic-nucleotide 2'-phosphodiesterase/3'-nucleotidase|uniref:bifunctional 2',3'-cyclic-nucleotide 2'-phosphodiesterase/3'-nucleotidase n=1 Tax=Alcanivorax sp. DSM 26293 TaxID=1798238 RepID=UPI0008A06CAA|nr:bifunctional 2',3'-cyclic-nucleotide 2'-phosphodiesterase/3'-nucleotidase [Alcanivorax sp. DSM 26293]MEE3388340.1 bifunctional 2',3'-cyclic-nucleotide 2'-phosphodiesterase/3'-nucleotidase [Pseudomonadota bacterium]SEG18877.1 2',3'-cyclic-nucleotide 2'-phosphodiesterase / 3'-nucleotidase [Alcanivorax sp. DSM 26293]